MTGRTLECTVFALEILAIQFVTVVATIVFVIASPTARNAFTVAASEFRFRAFAIFALALDFRFVTAIAAVVGKIAHPLSK